MIEKRALGLKIRQYREEKKLTREAFCGDETVLNVRQLSRIEQGESIPTIDKFEYIINRLNISFEDFFNFSPSISKSRYYRLKYRLIKFPTYGDEKRLQKQLQIIDRLYKSYGDALSEEELTRLDLLERIVELELYKEPVRVDHPCIDMLEETLNTKNYTLTDLLFIRFYLLNETLRKESNFTIVKEIKQTLLQQTLGSDDFYNHEFSLVLIVLSQFFEQHQAYDELAKVLQKWSLAQQVTQDYSIYPIFLIFKAKYSLYKKMDQKEALDYYQKALEVANLSEDMVLVRKIKEEQDKDHL